MNGYEFGAVGEGRFGLDFVDHGGNAIHDVVFLQNRRSVSHQIRDGLSVSGSFEYFVRNDGYRFRVIELETAALTTSGQVGGDDNHELFLFAGSEVHSRFFRFGGMST